MTAKNPRWIYLLIAVVLGLWSCDGDDAGSEPEPTPEGDFSVNIQSPSRGATVSGMATIMLGSITTLDEEVEPARIEYFVDDNSIHVDDNPSAPYSHTFNSEAFSDAYHGIRVAVESVGGQDGEGSVGVYIINTFMTSAQVTSDESAILQSPDGARIVIPRGAVPRESNGDVGTVLFSIENVGQLTGNPSVPAGLIPVGDAIRFGPGGSVFELPIEVGVPVGAGLDPGRVMLGRVNPTTNEIEIRGANYDPETGLVRGWTYEMSEWTAAEADDSWFDNQDWGIIMFINDLQEVNAIVCVDGFEPQFETDAHFGGEWVYLSPDSWKTVLTLLRR